MNCIARASYAIHFNFKNVYLMLSCFIYTTYIKQMFLHIGDKIMITNYIAVPLFIIFKKIV